MSNKVTKAVCIILILAMLSGFLSLIISLF